MAIAQMPPSRTELLSTPLPKVAAIPGQRRKAIGIILNLLHLRFILTLGAGITALSGTAFTALSALLAYKIARRSDCTVAEIHEPAQQRAAALSHHRPQPVSFHSNDGVRLSGSFYPGSRGEALILCHGFRACSLDLIGAAADFNARGYNVLLFDFRGHGQSEGKQSSIGYKERRDLCAAVEYLKGRPEVDPTRIGVMGISMGAATAILTAAECKDIKAVVADSSFAALTDVVHAAVRNMVKLGLPTPFVAGPLVMFSELFSGFKTTWVRPVDAISAIAPRPVLLIHSTGDALIHHTHCDRLYEAANAPKQRWVVDHAGHARTGEMYYDEYMTRVDDFFRQHLAAPVVNEV